MQIIAYGNGWKKTLADKLLEIKTPLTNQYTREPKQIMFAEDKIKRQTQFIKDRYGFKHGSKKNNKKKGK